MVLFLLGFVFLVIIYYGISWFCKKSHVPIPVKGSAVLITGAGTGFGKLTSLIMAKKGYRVYSGVLTEQEGVDLKNEFLKQNEQHNEGVIIPVIFDITNENHAQQVYHQLSTELKENGLSMLVNNAGIAFCSPLEMMPFKDYCRVIEVNLLGHVRVIQTMLPLIRKAGAGSRIVNITSMAGRVSGSGLSAYSGSKFALEAVSDALRREILHLGITVSVIEPAHAKTGILHDSLNYTKKILETCPEEIRLAYDEGSLVPSGKEWDDFMNLALVPDQIVDEIIHALTSSSPKTRYIVGRIAQIMIFLDWFFPDHVNDYLGQLLIKHFQKKKKKIRLVSI